MLLSKYLYLLSTFLASPWPFFSLLALICYFVGLRYSYMCCNLPSVSCTTIHVSFDFIFPMFSGSQKPERCTFYASVKSKRDSCTCCFLLVCSNFRQHSFYLLKCLKYQIVIVASPGVSLWLPLLIVLSLALHLFYRFHFFISLFCLLSCDYFSKPWSRITRHILSFTLLHFFLLNWSPPSKNTQSKKIVPSFNSRLVSQVLQNWREGHRFHTVDALAATMKDVVIG